MFVIFSNTLYKKVLDMLSKNWMTRGEISDVVGEEGVRDCLLILKKGNLLEEKWRMPVPGEKPQKEYKATYNKLRANFQCNFSDLTDLLTIAFSDEAEIAVKGGNLEEELTRGNSSINDIARRFGVTPVYIKGVAKRVPHLDVKGQGLVILEE
ncbi:MAG TPA: ArsR family transcriptional regulator [Methanospirillum sp.]|nr:ArsR family transcriptional regulator [Methanospirillum sp.]